MRLFKRRKKIPEIYIEMALTFDNDFDVNTITRELGIQPTECEQRFQTRINPITKQQNPGYWLIKSKTVVGYYAEEAIDDIISIIEGKIELIRKICVEHSGEVNFCVVPSFHKSEKPALCFSRRFMEIAAYLNANMEIDLYVF